MKNLNLIILALVCLALPAATFGQVTVDCPDCTHAVSVYMGGGGLIAEADDADMVTWVSTCGGVTVSGELEADDDGVVSTLFTMDNGLACHSEGGSFELGPIMDGGWYWITDDMNSAVGNLVAKDILKNDTVDITDAGDSVKTEMGKGAVYLKHEASGRVGILPNILPEPPMAPAAICGPRIPAGGKTYTSQLADSCMLGNGGTKIRLSGTDRGRATSLAAGAMLQRPFGTATYDIRADLWLNETGSYSSADLSAPDAAAAAAIQLGWPGKAVAGTNWLNATWTAAVGGVNGGEPTADAHGVVITDGSGSTPAGQTVVTISANDDYCPSTGTKHPLTVTLTATPAANAVFPAVRTSAATAAERRVSFTVVCSSASAANMGTDLVPENPFPVD